MRKYTYDDIAALRPCWLADGREAELRQRTAPGVTASQIATAKGVTIADRRWVLVRLAARLPGGHQMLVRWAAGCAQDVRRLVPEGEHRDAVDTAIQTAVAWSEGAASAEACREAAQGARNSFLELRSAAYAAAYAADAAYAAAYAAAAYAPDAPAAAAEAAAYAAYAAASAAAEKQLVTLAAMMEAA